VTIFFIFAGAISAQTTYSVPKKVDLEKIVQKTFPNYFGQEFPHLIPETFFPIGWSRDGKFAYYTEPVDEACGCYFAHLIIQDLRTDKIIWDFKYNQGLEGDNDGNIHPEDTIKKLWTKNQKLFSKKLSENGIVASDSTLLGKTFTSGGRKYTATTKITKGENPDGYEPRVDKISLILSTPKLGSKQVYSADHSKEEYWFMLDAAIVGALKSPFENRVAVIAIEVMRGYEGPPHTADIRIVGADLFSGFGKKQ
jgi:hypothetical protein